MAERERPVFDDFYGAQRRNPLGRQEKSEAEETVAEALEMLKNADKYVALGETVVTAAKPALIKALAILLGTLGDVRRDLEPQLGNLSLLSASALHRDYANYVKAGFSKDQAFRLILAALKPFNFSEMVSSVASKATSAKKKDE